MLGRQTIKKDPTSPGDSPPIGGESPNLYSETFKEVQRNHEKLAARALESKHLNP